MNHSNLRIIIDPRNNHPYAVSSRLKFFAQKARVSLQLIEATRQRIVYAITKG